MKILLVSPRARTGGLESLRSGSQILQGILYVAAATRQAGFDTIVTIADEEDILRQVKWFKPLLIGFSCVTATYPIVREMIRLVKSSYPELKTIVGGHHVTFLTAEVFSETGVDYICRGEGEEAFPALLRSIKEGDWYPKIDGIAYQKEGQCYNLETTAILEDLNKLPMITQDLVVPGLTFAPKIVTSRGCPFKCSFCSISAFYQGKWRQRTVESVMADIEYWVNLGHRQFWFHDDNLTVDSRWVRQFCAELKNRKLKIRWNCMSRVDSICRDPEMVKIMADAGCALMSIGIESGIQEVLNRFHKSITLEQIQQAIDILNHSSIFHNWYMIIGSGDEYDTADYLQQNIDFFSKIPFDFLLISVLTPFPGTEFYEKITSEHRLLHRNWEQFDCTHCVYQPQGITPAELESYISKAYRQLYWHRGLKNIPVIFKGLRRGAIRSKMIINGIRIMFNTFMRKREFHSSLNKKF